MEDLITRLDCRSLSFGRLKRQNANPDNTISMLAISAIASILPFRTRTKMLWTDLLVHSSNNLVCRMLELVHQ